ncbi:hypothetical protein NIES2101_03435 [Calothrix sp. HK-06]|nr:hypothetical protein NIES2101_03435 [Calothrix sp. HK-06]
MEGFRDPNVLGSGARTAIGFTADGRKLILANFDVNLTLPKLAEVMKVMSKIRVSTFRHFYNSCRTAI